MERAVSRDCRMPYVGIAVALDRGDATGEQIRIGVVAIAASYERHLLVVQTKDVRVVVAGAIGHELKDGIGHVVIIT